MTRPAPLRSAAVPTRNAAPVLPAEPATTSRCPELPLCASALRRGMRAAIPARRADGSVRRGRSARRPARPRSTSSIRPTGADASTTRPSLRAPIVAVTSARKTTPAARPLSASSPEGMSTAILRPPAAFIAASAAAGTSRTGPRNPVPKMASTTASTTASPASASPSRARQVASSVQPLPSSTATLPSCSSAASAAAASPWIFAFGAASSTRTERPASASWRAATNPSPPFEPPPQTIVTRPARARPARAGRSRRRPRPAVSMSRRVGTPSARATAASAARISAAVRTSGKSTLRVPRRRAAAITARSSSTAARIPSSTARATRPWPMLSSSSPGSATTGARFA